MIYRMKTVVILFADSDSLHIFDRAFGGKSAFARCLEWAAAVPDSAGTVVLAGAENSARCGEEAAAVSGCGAAEIVTRQRWTVAELFRQIAASAEKYGADTAVYAWADCPFLDGGITAEIVSTHTKYAAEYTFADGWPYGFSPEALDRGAAAVLAHLSEETHPEEGRKRVARESVFSVIRTDINSFEIETVLAPKDWRLYRLSFDCGSRANFAACAALYGDGLAGKDASALSGEAVLRADVLKTVPAFYNVQISEKCAGGCVYCPYAPLVKSGGVSGRMMRAAEFRALAGKIAAFSENAVVSLSAWGEGTEHPDFSEIVGAALSYPGLSVLVETDGRSVSGDLCAEIRRVADGAPERVNGLEKIMWIVSLDAFTKETYAKIRGGESGFAQAVAAVALLEQFFPGAVYPQMVRMNENEAELEHFYRFWHDRESPSHGSVIVQKYDSFCGLLPECRPVDFSPVERNPCWHLRRDMTILADGSVPLCRESVRGGVIGNALTEPLEAVWERATPVLEAHIHNQYPERCGKCDEYYTFNF